MQNAPLHDVLAPTHEFSHDLQTLLLPNRPFPLKIVVKIAAFAVLGDDHQFVAFLLLVEFEDIGVIQLFQDGNLIVDEFLPQFVAVERGIYDFDAESLSLAADCLVDLRRVARPHLLLQEETFALHL
jgi:hypothetical protein